MTASPPAPGISDATITARQASGLAHLAAAARDLDGLPPGVPVASSAVLAPRDGVETSTVNLATMVLAGHGLLTRARRHYFLARPAPPQPEPPAANPPASKPGHPPCLR